MQSLFSPCFKVWWRRTRGKHVWALPTTISSLLLSITALGSMNLTLTELVFMCKSACISNQLKYAALHIRRRDFLSSRLRGMCLCWTLKPTSSFISSLWLPVSLAVLSLQERHHTSRVLSTLIAKCYVELTRALSGYLKHLNTNLSALSPKRS
jgi:hypothetical protein